MTKSGIYDLINVETTDNDFLPIVEAAYPSIPPGVGEVLHLVYEQDFSPGLISGGDPLETNSIIYLRLDKNTFGMVSAAPEAGGGAAASLALSPNPAAGELRAAFELSRPAEVRLSVASLLGETVFFEKKQALPAGRHSVLLGLEGLESGVWLVRLETDGEAVVRKLVVQQR